VQQIKINLPHLQFFNKAGPKTYLEAIFGPSIKMEISTGNKNRPGNFPTRFSKAVSKNFESLNQLNMPAGKVSPTSKANKIGPNYITA
jgi:hypothetical protein